MKLLLLIIIFIFSCSKHPLTLEDKAIVPDSGKYFSIYNRDNASMKDLNNPSPSDNILGISLEELLNKDYAWSGTMEGKNILFTFEYNKYTKEISVYSSSVKETDIDKSYPYKLYENRTLLPTTIRTNSDVLTMSFNPVFYMLEYDNFMGNNFGILSYGYYEGYLPNIVPSSNSIERRVSYPHTNKLLPNISKYELKYKVIGGVWYSVINSCFSKNAYENYIFLENSDISVSKDNQIPDGSLTLNRGWDIWQYKYYDGLTNYIYIYDYYYLYIGTNRSITIIKVDGSKEVRNGDVLFLYKNKPSSGDIASYNPSYRFIKYFVKP